MVSQTGVAPSQPIGWPSSAVVQERQYVSVPLQMGGSDVSAMTPNVHNSRARPLARAQPLA